MFGASDACPCYARDAVSPIRTFSVVLADGYENKALVFLFVRKVINEFLLKLLTVFKMSRQYFSDSRIFFNAFHSQKVLCSDYG